MDTSLFYPSYLNLGEAEAERLVWRLIDDAERIGGAFTINWHDRSIAPERLWGDFYLRLLGELERRKAWLPTASKAVAWFRKRRSATLDVVRAEEGMIKVRGRVNGADRLPGLRVRVHKPRTRSLGDPLASRTPAEFVDVPLNDSADLNIAL